MDMNIETLKHLVDYGVIALLVFMSFIAVWFFIERVIFYKNIDVKSYKNKKALDIEPHPYLYTNLGDRKSVV